MGRTTASQYRGEAAGMPALALAATNLHLSNSMSFPDERPQCRASGFVPPADNCLCRAVGAVSKRRAGDGGEDGGEGGEGGGGEDPNNPVSEVYGGPMVDFHRAQFWAWDARPYPAFPSEVNVWSDYPNWQNGHWLNGRLGMVLLADLIAELLTSSGVTEFDVSQVTGIADGYLIGDGSSARQALDVLIELHRLAVFEDAGTVFFRSPGFDPVTVLALEQIVHAGNDPVTSFVREQETEVPIAVQITHFDPYFDFQETHTRAARINASGVRQKTIHTPMVLGRDGALPLLEAWLHARWTARDSVTFGLSRQHEHLTVGDVIAFSDAELADTWRITRIDSGDQLSIAAIAKELGEHLSPALLTEFARTPASHGFGRPLSRFMDLPYLPTLPDNGGNCLAVVAAPWPGELAVYASPSDEGYSYQQSIDSAAFIGELEIGLDPGAVTGRWDYQSCLRLKLHHGSLASLSSELVLNGANGLAVQSASSAFEIIQFQTAELVAEQTYKLSNLLRGQAGTEVEAAQGAATGAPVIVLNQAVTRLLGDDKLRGLETNWLVGPVGKQLDGVEFSQSVFTPGYRSLQPYSPVHLRAVTSQTGDVEISWIRRDRINADDWAAVEIPMSEAAEAYDITVTSQLPGQLTESVSRPSLSVSSEALIAAFGALPAELTIAVSQISNTVGLGPAAILKISP
ncbi:MAG: phage tail protein [Rhizobiaceae bacterium]